MSAGARDNFQNQFSARSQDSGSIHSFYDVTANPLDKEALGSKSDKRRRLMLKGSVHSSIQMGASQLKSDKRKQLMLQGAVDNGCTNNLFGCELQAGTSKIGQASYQKSIQDFDVTDEMHLIQDGAVSHQFFSILFAKKEMSIHLVNLDAASKTTILYKLKLGVSHRFPR